MGGRSSTRFCQAIIQSNIMKPPRFIWIVLLAVAIVGCLLSAPPARVARIRVINVPALSKSSLNVSNPAPIMGILTNPNFQVVLRALQQRQGYERLSEPEVVTTSGRAVKRMFDYERFTFYINITNR